MLSQLWKKQTLTWIATKVENRSNTWLGIIWGEINKRTIGKEEAGYVETRRRAQHSGGSNNGEQWLPQASWGERRKYLPGTGKREPCRGGCLTGAVIWWRDPSGTGQGSLLMFIHACQPPRTDSKVERGSTRTNIAYTAHEIMGTNTQKDILLTCWLRHAYECNDSPHQWQFTPPRLSWALGIWIMSE